MWAEGDMNEECGKMLGEGMTCVALQQYTKLNQNRKHHASRAEEMEKKKYSSTNVAGY